MSAGGWVAGLEGERADGLVREKVWGMGEAR
jgi:hypothetical protein